MRLHVIKHVAFEGPGTIEIWAKDRGHELRVTELEAGELLPEVKDFDALVIMGGPMSVNDEALYPWLAPEKALVREALASGRKLLGVCLGAQMIASALGAKVYPNPYKEIGFFPIETTPQAATHPFFRGLPQAFTVFHWHGETYDLPNGAVWLARSKACAHQAYAVGNQALALQFHLEVTEASLKAMSGAIEEEITQGGPYVQSHPAMLAHSGELRGFSSLCVTLLDNWFAA